MVTLLSGSVPGLNTLQLGYRAKVREKGRESSPVHQPVSQELGREREWVRQ